MAVLVLLLCCIPCSDAVACVIGQQHEVLHKGQTPESRHNRSEHGDICSPFCQCACCAIACALPFSGQHASPACSPPGATAYASLIAPAPTDRPIPVWQPPQLV